MADTTDKSESSDWNLEKPLSPVLSNKTTRKYLLNRKTQRKSRVKLTERFSDENVSTQTPNSSFNEILQLTSSSDIRHTGEIEIIDHKKLESPSLLINERNDLKDGEISFKTAGGRNVYSVSSEEMLKQSKRLFHDILHFSEDTEVVSRSNKYSFLSKKKATDDYRKQIVNLSEKENIARNVASPFSNSCKQSKFCFQKESGRKVQSSDSAFKAACKLLEPESNSSNVIVDEQDLLSTQETNKIFSNFIVEENGEYEKLELLSFRGFTTTEEEKSRKMHMELELIISQLVQNMKNNIGAIMPNTKSQLYHRSEKSTNQSCFDKNVQILDKIEKLSPRLQQGLSQKIEIKTEDNQDLDFLSSQELNQLFTEMESDQLEETIVAKDFKGFTVNMIQESSNYLKKFVTTISKDSKEKEMLNQESFATIGFKSAAGNNYHISTSLAKGQQTFKDFDFEPTINQSPARFSGASNKNKTVATQSSNAKKKRLNSVHNGNLRSKFRSSFENKSPTPVKSQETKKLISDLSGSIPKSFQENQSSTRSTGFMTAAGNKYKISNTCLAKVKQTFKDFDFGSSAENFSVTSNKKVEINANEDSDHKYISSFETAGKISLNLPQKSIDNVPNYDKHTQSIRSHAGFSTAAGNKYRISDSALAKVQQTFKDIDLGILGNESFTTNFCVTSNKKVYTKECEDSSQSYATGKTSENLPQKAVDNLPDPGIKIQGSQKGYSVGFTTAAGNKHHISDSALAKVQQTFKDFDFLPLQKNSEKSRLGDEPTNKASINLLQETVTKPKQSLTNCDNGSSLDDSSIINDSSTLQADVSFEGSTSDMSVVNKTSINRTHRTKRLGVSSRKQIAISQEKIDRAMKIFDDEKIAAMSPLKTNVSGVFNSTPLKNTSFVPIDSEITPIKTVKSTVVESKRCVDAWVDSRFKMHECTKGTLDSWNAALENEKRMLEMRIRMIAEKQKGLSMQKHLLERNSQDRQIRRNGILYNKKNGNFRVSLQHFVKIDRSTCGSDIVPQNALNVHFSYTDQNLSSVTTSDGACVIPNVNNEIGVSEIEIAFKVMPGVDVKLIPTGWIRNHFKWIVWKLASYERFSANMKNCLTLDNVVQQLKYRYDREIDKAERPTLRRIFELDDAPQKRIVLCVSQIFNLESGQRELELTDGWYSIRTSIDEVLCRQTVNRKIQVGTKLMICGAELLNCEGCHPLQCTDTVRLKINANSTRRTRWYVKLGYQKFAEPFPVKLCSALANGGLIGCVKIFVARVYPVKYLEKQNKLTIWRNRKAEELYAQEWENKVRQDMVKIRNAVVRDYEKQTRDKSHHKNLSVSINEICKINCPETLFHLYQNNKDPERFQELLSPSQKNSISEYQQRLSFLQQQELSRKLDDSVSGLQRNKRDVTSVLQLRVIDILDEDRKDFTFQIWKPSDTHFEVIKESTVFYVYNVVPKKNGNFSTMSRTKFQVDQKEFPEVTKYKRNLLRISDVVNSCLTEKILFNEFDTVGIVVALKVDSFTQNLWLADPLGGLLFVKIFESPKNCLLLDNLTIGRSVAVSNLIYSRSQSDFGEAIANHLTIISSYPQLKHLKEGINVLNNELPENLQVFLKECEQKISYCINKISVSAENRTSSRSLVQSSSLMSSDIFDESSDVLFSMIDIDKYK